MKPLALIEHDRALCSELRVTVESAGFRTETFHRGIDAIRSIRSRSFALAILGLDLLDTDPFVVCREASGFVPILTIARDHQTETCVRALEAGADDCVCRPVAGRELLARIRNILQRAGSGEGQPVVGTRTLQLSLAEMRVRSEGVVHDLTLGETELLALLLHYSPAPLSSSQIADLLGARQATVESRIKSLRRKLGGGRLVSRGRLGYVLEEELTVSEPGRTRS